MARHRLTAGSKLHHRFVVGSFIVDSLRFAALGRDHLLGKIALAVVIVLDAMYHGLCGNELICKSNIRLGSADNLTFLVLIIILFLCGDVNRTDDVSVAIVDIEKLRTSN